MTYKLFLDDIRSADWVYPDEAVDSWVVCRSYAAAVDTVNSQGWPCHVSFDHDLGEAVPSGMDFAHYLVEKSLDEIDSGGQGLPKSFEYRVHSANPIGAENIQALLQRYIELIRQV